MLQDIAPYTYNNDFSFRKAEPTDKLVIYQGKSVLARVEGEKIAAPTFADFDLDPAKDCFTGSCIEPLPAEEEIAKVPYVYIFSVSLGAEGKQDHYFLADLPEGSIEAILEHPDWQLIPILDMVNFFPKQVRFALSMGHEYWHWYETSQYCGRCGAKTVHDAHERMMRCPKCEFMIFPRLHPAVIVGITRPDGKVLATRYAGRPNKNYAFVAGYCEMGETVEQTVHREVAEEVGLKVKNLRYYKSQPWPDTSSLLYGFFCEVDGPSDIDFDEHELSAAEWVDRFELLTDNDNSLTREMMRVLTEGREEDYCITS